MASEEMRYGMLGDDRSTDEEKLVKYSGQVGWEYLREHYKNGVLFFVDPELKLEEAGAAITDDQTKKVEGWLKSADLVKIEALHATQWKDSDQQFEALVVSPFVLFRPIS
jgi:hypothetical protein|tara:strand:+ start:388 stop:717 length:330 start_codon:yes stop_codon:yes gene_type:complete